MMKNEQELIKFCRRHFVKTKQKHLQNNQLTLLYLGLGVGCDKTGWEAWAR